MSNAPTLINLPPPPSDPVTPSDIPGTPNSTTTSMSELSTVAIKDGHRGHLPHHSSHAASHTVSGLSNQLDAERADRISRLAGLERVTTARNPHPLGNAASVGGGSFTPGNLTPGAAAPPHNAPLSYFDAQGNPMLGRERSTVGSASATGSVGARTTWAGDSEAGDLESMDLDTSSVGGLSEEGGTTSSLVGFGEGARTPARQSVISSPGGGGGGIGGGGLGGLNKGATPTSARDARMIDGMTYDADVLDTTSTPDAAAAQRRTMTASPSGVEQAERIVRENMNTTSADRMRSGQGPGDLGKFGFEK